MANERSDHTLQATALVHEAYVRLVDTEKAEHWNSRGHFFSAAAEAMRRILVEQDKAKQRDKRGGKLLKLNVNHVEPVDESHSELIFAIDEALEILAAEEERFAVLVKLRYFAGFSLPEVAEAMEIGKSTAYEWLSYAKS